MKKLFTTFCCVSVYAVLLFSSYAFSQEIKDYRQPGTYKFVVPAGVYSINVEAWGAGSSGRKDTHRGGGGGAYAGTNSIAVQPGSEYTIIVGAGAKAGTGGPGGNSSFGSSVVLAKGANGAEGGKASESLGAIRYSGGNGGRSSVDALGGAGGGGSAGPSGNGGNGGDTDNSNGGAAGIGADSGANGGKGGNFALPGEDGEFPGGGGGERGDKFIIAADNGAGGNGRVIITYKYAYVAQIISADIGSSLWCPGETRNISVTIKNIGTHPWTDGNGKDFNIGVKWNTNNNNWKDYHVRVDAQNLQPGETKIYTFTVTASNHDGNGYTTALPVGKNNLTFDVVNEGVSWFGWNMNGVGPGNSSFTSPNQNITQPAAIADNVLSYGTAVGATANENGSASVTAPAGNYFTTVNFASYGSPSGTFPDFKINACHSPKSQTEVEKRLLGNSGSVSVPATNDVFGDPCVGTGKKLYFIASHAQPVCEGTVITINGSTPSGGNGSYTYLWQSSTTDATSGFGPAAGTNNLKNYISPPLTQTTWFRRVVFSCSNTAYSNVVYVKVNPSKPASVNISASSTSICHGNEVTFTATATNGGSSPSFQWKLNGNNITGATASTYKTNTLQNNDIITVVLSSNATPCLTGSPATSNPLKITVNPNLIAGVNISANATTICAGSTVTFTAVPSNGGTAPKYQWKLNGADISGATSSSLILSNLKDKDAVTVEMTSNATPCLTGTSVTSQPVVIKVNQNLPVSVSISSDLTTICSSTPVTFTARPINGGSTPNYTWKINGIVTGTNSPVFSTSMLQDGDEVSVEMISSLNSCIAGSPAGSNVIKIAVLPVLQASVLATASNTTLCAGAKVTFTATPTNGGSAPAYQWFVNGVAVAGQTAATFETKELKNGDKVSVKLTPSAQQCVSPEPVVSNIITMAEETTVYENGKWSKGIPTAENQLSAEIRQTYSTADGAVSACSVHLVGSAIVTVVPKNPLIVYNNINLDNVTKLTVESDANLIQVNDSAPANTGNITVLRDLKIKPKSAEYNYFGSPVTFAAGQSMKTIYPGITYVLYHNEANNYFYNSSGANIPGRGLAVKEPSITDNTPNGAYDLTAVFVGVPQNGIINFALANSNTATSSHLGYNLVGNPYPSNIDLQALYELNKGQIAADPAISTSFYFWDSTANNVYVQQGSNYGGQAYSVFNAKSGSKGMGIPAAGPKGSLTSRKVPKSEITVGQGFMVKAMKKNAVLQFNNSIRTDKNSGVKFIGARGEEVVDDRYWLSVTTPGNLTSTLAVVYFDGGTEALGAEDSEARGGSDEVFSLVSGKNIAINGKSTFADTDVVAIGTRHFAAGQHTIALEKAEGIFASGQQIYLKDKLTGAVANLSQGNYTFEAQAGESTGRFEIVYKPSGVLASDATVKEEVQVYRAADDFVVKTPKRITAIDIYDMSGRMMSTAKPNSAEYTLNGSELANGVYLMKIRQGSEQTVKKIVK